MTVEAKKQGFGFAESFADDLGPDSMGDGGAKKYFGKYRGTVLNNVDPKKMGRVQVQVPDIGGVGITGWAAQCLSFGGIESGTYVVPMIGAGVWVEFEQGNPSYPILTGYWWGSTAEVPKTALTTTPGVPTVITQTPSQNALVISDGPSTCAPLPMPAGGVGLRSGASALTLTPEGVTIMAPKVDIRGLQVNINGLVTFNFGALQILP